MKKYVVLESNMYEDIKSLLSKYDIDCSPTVLYNEPFAVLKESTTYKNDGEEQNISSCLKVGGTKRSKKYNSIAYGINVNGEFVPDGITVTYSELKKRGIYISPCELNIKNFMEDCELESYDVECKFLGLSSLKLEFDHKKLLNYLFELDNQNYFTGYDFWKNVIDSAVYGGLFIRPLNSKESNSKSYLWSVGNSGLSIINERCYLVDVFDSIINSYGKIRMMDNIFHFLIPELLYTQNKNKSEYDLSYSFHKIIVECFTTVLTNMFYFHYLTLNGSDPRRYMDKEAHERDIYPIFEEIYKKKTDVFNINTIEEVCRASCIYGTTGNDSGFISLFVKYNGCYKLSEFRELLEKYKDNYKRCLFQNMEQTMHNAECIKQQYNVYDHFNNDKIDLIVKRLDIIPLKDIKIKSERNIEDFIDIVMGQLKKSLSKGSYKCYENTLLKNKFSRWALGQLCFFEKYASIPVVDGHKSVFYNSLESILNENNVKITLDKIELFKHTWHCLMKECEEKTIISAQECILYKEMFPIFDTKISTNVDEIIQKCLNF